MFCVRRTFFFFRVFPLYESSSLGWGVLSTDVLKSFSENTTHGCGVASSSLEEREEGYGVVHFFFWSVGF